MFPSAIPPPQEAEEARQSRFKELLYSSLKGIAVRAFIAVFELVAALIFGSAVLFMDALSTGLDIATSFALVLSFKLASKPPDRNHPFGHGRFEPLAGFQLGLFLALLGAGMFYYNTIEVSHAKGEDGIPSFLWIVPLITILLLEMSYRLLMRTAKKQKSPALAAEAVHYRVDSLTSLLAMITLLIAGYFPQFSQVFDHIGAAFIALFMVFVGINAARTNMHQILDRIPSKEYFDRVKEAAKRAAGVLGTEKIRMQLFGPDAYVGIDIEVDPELSVKIAHRISQKVRYEIQKELPQVRDVIVHIEPFYPGDHPDN
jgi:cation diffusion facilitator family transporter